MSRTARPARHRTAAVRAAAVAGAVVVLVPGLSACASPDDDRVTTGTGDGGVDVSVPRSDTSRHVVSAHTGDGKVTVRTAN